MYSMKQRLVHTIILSYKANNCSCYIPVKMSSLDDFFAKKDKKKGGKGKKFSKANTDILAKNLEEQEKKEAEGNVKTSVPLATSEVNKAQAALASNNDNTVS